MTVSARVLAVMVFFLSSIPLLFVHQDNVCFMMSESHFIYLNQILSSGNDDYVAFLISAVFIVLYTPLLALSKSKIAYIGSLLIYFVLQSVIFIWIESTSAYTMIMDSIYHCGNNYLLAWITLAAMCIGLSGIFIFFC